MGMFRDWYDVLVYLEGLEEQERRNIFFRVDDEYSQAISSETFGISARGQDSVSFGARKGRRFQQLRRAVSNHLDWSSPYVSPFISFYRNNDVVAMAEAERRLARGRQDVTITVINVRKVFRKERVHYRNIRLLADKLNIEIPEKAWNNSKYEYVFLHHVPANAVLGVIPI